MVGRRGGGVGCRGLLGWVCPKRRGLKPRWRGCLQETRRWAGVFVVFPVCFRCAFGVVLHGARADLLRFGHLARSLRRAGTRVGLSGGPGWGGALEGAWALSWTGACAANASSRLIMRAGASSSGTKPALMKAAVPVDDRDPRHPRPPLPRRPGLDQPRIPPSTLEDRPRTTDTTCRNTRESTNKPSAFSTSMDSPAHALRPA